MNRKVDIREYEAIPVRSPGLHPGPSVPRHFHGGDPFLSAFFAALSSVFPDGERFFIDSVRHYRDQLGDPELARQVRAFIGQEAHHGREHEAFNEWLEEKGYPMAGVIRQVREGLEMARRNMSPRRQLAMTISLEHFTAIMANRFLEDEDLSEQLHPEIRELFLWHAVEETEHKAVAYDVYEATGGDYWTRAVVMLEVTLFFWLHMMSITWHFLKSEGNAGIMRMARGFAWLLVWPGPIRRMLPDYLAWFRPGFHPWQQDNRDLILPLQERMAGWETGK